MKPLNLDMAGIKCDACDYKDMEVQITDYKEWLNKPCPKCGASLLTEADLKTITRLNKIIGFFNWVLSPFIKVDESTQLQKMSVEMNGTGEVKFVPLDE